jgi:hypothetical protein
MIEAKDMRPGTLYRRTVDPGRFWYTRPPKGAAQRLVKRLSLRRDIKARDFEALQASRLELRGEGVLAVRHLRGVDPVNGRRFVLEDYVLLPLAYKLREIKRPPGGRLRRGDQQAQAGAGGGVANRPNRKREVKERESLASPADLRARLLESEERRLSEDAEDATWD